MSLITLDLDDPADVADRLRHAATAIEGVLLREIADRIEAQPKSLIVLDLGEDDPHHYIKALCQAEKKNHAYNLALRNLADQIAQQIRPVRIPEPKHIGSLVTAGYASSDGVAVWTKYSETNGNNWINPTGLRHSWSALINPEPFPFGGKS